MSSDTTFNTIVLAAVIAYAMGAIPVAYVAGRIYGVNIFEIGSHQAGATNVFREVSRPTGIAVMLIDSIKALVAIVIARLLGLDGVELLVPAFAAVAGHWNSPFTKFKGGDGVSSLTGVGLGIAPLALLMPYALMAFITLGLNSKFKHPSLWAATAGYSLFITLSFLPNSNMDPAIVYGLTGLGIGILLHSLYFHRRHRQYLLMSERLEEELDPTITQDGIG